MSVVTRKGNAREETWEVPSLEWIHRVRRERQCERGERPLCPLSPVASERLAQAYGLRVVRPVGRPRRMVPR
jgi:hypothetical protein